MSNLLLLQNTFSPWTIKVGCGQLRNSEIIALSVNKKGEFFPYELVFYPPENSSQSNSISYCGLARWVFCLIFFFSFRLERKTENTWSNYLKAMHTWGMNRLTLNIWWPGPVKNRVWSHLLCLFHRCKIAEWPWPFKG